MGTHVSQAPDRRGSGRDEVASMRNEDVVSMKSHRVRGDQKRNPSFARTKANIKSLERKSTGLM
jgi:hypothetical protein